MVINMLKIMTIAPMRTILLRFIPLDYPSNLHGQEKHDDSTDAIDPNEAWLANPTHFILVTLATNQTKDAQCQHRNR